LNEDRKRYGLLLNTGKTKTMVFGSSVIAGRKISVEEIEIENVERVTYLESNITQSKSISLQTKLSVSQTIKLKYI